MQQPLGRKAMVRMQDELLSRTNLSVQAMSRAWILLNIASRVRVHINKLILDRNLTSLVVIITLKLLDSLMFPICLYLKDLTGMDLVSLVILSKWRKIVDWECLHLKALIFKFKIRISSGNWGTKPAMISKWKRIRRIIKATINPILKIIRLILVANSKIDSAWL